MALFRSWPALARSVVERAQHYLDWRRQFLAFAQQQRLEVFSGRGALAIWEVAHQTRYRLISHGGWRVSVSEDPRIPADDRRVWHMHLADDPAQAYVLYRRGAIIGPAVQLGFWGNATQMLWAREIHREYLAGINVDVFAMLADLLTILQAAERLAAGP